MFACRLRAIEFVVQHDFRASPAKRIDVFFFIRSVKTDSGTLTVLSVVKQPRREVDHSPPSIAES
jgi:hypothetical protein